MQTRVVEMSPQHHQLILGSPGSGKTVVILHRARHLADTYSVSLERYRIFVFTNALRSYIQSALDDLGLPDECVLTFDSWCRTYYEEHINRRVPWIKKSGPDYKAIRSEVCSHVRKAKSKFFDFLLVDEGQDLDSTAYEILVSISQHTTVFMDSKQQIYDIDSTEQSILRILRAPLKTSGFFRFSVKWCDDDECILNFGCLK